MITVDWKNTFRPHKLSSGSRVKPKYKSFYSNYLKSLIDFKGGNKECPVCKKPIDKHLCATLPLKMGDKWISVNTCLTGNCYITYESWITELVDKHNIKPY